MNPYYYDELPTAVNEEEIMMILGVVLIVLGVILLVCLIFALLRSFALYSIAKRRGISKAWLAWIPIGKDWILGSLSDQYQHLALGQVKARRKILMALNLAAFAVMILSIPMEVLPVLIDPEGEQTAVWTIAEAIPSLLTSGISIAAMVFYQMCNYDLYRSCDPKNAVVFLVIGIIIPVTEPFFYLANRKKDGGMPKAEPAFTEIPAPAIPEPAGPEL